MNGYMLWQEKVELAERVQHAASYFEKKFGVRPTVAFANPQLLTDHEQIVDGIAVKGMRTVALNCLWIGLEQATQEVERESNDLVGRVMLAAGTVQATHA